MIDQQWQRGVVTQGGGYGPPPGGYGPPGGMPPGGAPPGGYGPPGGGAPPGAPPGGYGPPGGGAPPGGYVPPGGAPPGGYGPPGPGQYGQPMPPGGGPMLGGAPGGPNEELKKQAKTWMIISIVSAFCCTGCFGVIGAIFCYLATTALDQGNVPDAEAKLKWGKIVTILGIVLGALGAVGYVAATVLAQL